LELIRNKYTTPLVSICCLTYNHEPYIRRAIEGFLIQKTNFLFEVIIHDDASTDLTASIIEEYRIKNPDIILPIYQQVNQRSQETKRVVEIVFNYARGKYIALCEGDDYWIDPFKLQKQVDFLEKNENFGLVHGGINAYDEKRKKWRYNLDSNKNNNRNISSAFDLFYLIINNEYRIRTPTVLFRKKLLDLIPPNRVNFLLGDIPLWLDLSQLTRFYYFNEVFSVYRHVSNSVTRQINKTKLYRFILSTCEVRLYYCHKYNYSINTKLKRKYNKALIMYKLYDPNYNGLFPLQGQSKINGYILKHINDQFIRYAVLLYIRFFSFLKFLFKILRLKRKTEKNVNITALSINGNIL
jgi:glycosyltransferase involved in cell wall biosynthesis